MWCSLLLLWLCAASVDGDTVSELDDVFAGKMREMQRVFVGVEQQLSAARQVAELFVLEDAQLEMFALETRAQLTSIQEEVRQEMKSAMEEVGTMRQKALGDATTWKKMLQRLKDATEKKEKQLAKMRPEKEENQEEELKMQKEKELELMQELEKQKVIEKKLEREVEEEERKLQQVERQMEEEKKQQLEEEEKRRAEEKELKTQREQEARTSDSVKSDMEREEVVTLNEGGQRTGTVKGLLDWYVSTDQAVLDAARALYRQLVLPVVAILGFFLVLTMAIARYNAMKQARRNRRVLYSGYPKSYQPKGKQEMKPALTDSADVRPRPRHPISRRDPNGFIGN